MHLFCVPDEELDAERAALSPEERATLDAFALTPPEPLPYVAPSIPKTDARRLPYSGPFPRKRHYHRCPKCVERGGAGVNCYKQRCTKPVFLSTPCGWCR